MRRVLAVGLGLAILVGAAPVVAQQRYMDDGTFAVGQDITAGRYGARVPTDGGGCTWQRLSGVTGDPAEVIEEATVASGAAYVDIAATDVAFSSQGCGTWHLVGDAASPAPTTAPTTAPTATGTTPYAEFLPGLTVILDDLADAPSPRRGFRRWSNNAYPRAVTYLLTVHPDACYLPLYTEAWRVAGAIASVNSVARIQERRVRRSFRDIREAALASATTQQLLAEAAAACAS